MLDKKGLTHYSSGFSYMLNWCEHHIRKENGHEVTVSKEDVNIIKSEHMPHLEELRDYLLEQFRRIQHDESVLRKILRKEKAVKKELSTEEIIVAAVSEIIVNLKRAFNLANDSWGFRMSEFMIHLKAADRAINDLRNATRHLEKIVDKESEMLKSEVPEHQEEIKRILLELN